MLFSRRRALIFYNPPLLRIDVSGRAPRGERVSQPLGSALVVLAACDAAKDAFTAIEH